MIINNVELEDIDIFDLDTAEKYEKATKQFQKEASESAESAKAGNDGLAKIIKKQCNALFDCFNTIFGPGTDKKVFGNKTNLMVCLKAFEELISHADSQKAEMEKIANKYSPNRVQKRAK